MTAWNGSTRAKQLPGDWKKRREAVFARDGYRCVWILDDGSRCLAAATDCDHIINGGSHDLTNLQSLCHPHHQVKTNRESVAVRAERSALARHPAEPHPGYL